jgi:hypothetical protein
LTIKGPPNNQNQLDKEIQRAEGVAQVVEILLSKPKALSSNPSTTKKKNTKQPQSLIFEYASITKTVWCWH